MSLCWGSNHCNRVVVTGLGVISPVGLNVCATWEALIEGRCGVDRITRFDTQDLPQYLSNKR